MEAFLALGFVIGMSHALEADHLAAIGTFAVRNGPKEGSRRLMARGVAWGLGHTVTLFAITASVVGLGLVLTDGVRATLEFAVGVALVVLGLDVLRTMRRSRVHFHVHDHGDGRPHIHAHAHGNAAIAHDQDRHDHAHARTIPVRAFLVGLLHGAAGSAGLLALAVVATNSALMALAYALVFGFGSVAGMAVLSFAAVWPLQRVERGAAWLHRGLMLAAAALAIGIGIDTMVETIPYSLP